MLGLYKTVALIVGSWALLAAVPALAEPWYYHDKDNLAFQIPDKVQHYWGSYLLSETTSPSRAFLAGFLWEVKQKFQGQEFGEKDMLLNFLGSYKIGFVTWNRRDERWTFKIILKI